MKNKLIQSMTPRRSIAPPPDVPRLRPKAHFFAESSLSFDSAYPLPSRTDYTLATLSRPAKVEFGGRRACARAHPCVYLGRVR